MSSLPPLVTQLTYCAAALARVGAEFRPTVARSMSDAVTCIFISDISLVEKRFLSQFERSVQSKKSSERKVNLRSPSTWLLFAEALESNQLPKSIPPNPTTTSHTPPSLLTSYPPLATHANEIIEVFNALRACAPISAARGYQYFSDCSADGKGNGDIGHEELQDQNLISPTDGLGILEIFEHLLMREGRVIFDYVIAVLELEESLVGDSSSRVSMEPSREYAIAIAFASAFFETWVPWAMKAIKNGIFGLADTASQKSLTIEMEEPGSKLGQLLADWQGWVENSTKDVVSPFPQTPFAV